MKKNIWKRNNIIFNLEISESKPLWENEGVSQLVRLSVFKEDNSNLLLSTNLGIDYVLEIFNKQRYGDLIFDKENCPDYFYFEKYKFYYIVNKFGEYEVLEGDDCEDFYDWFIQILSVIEGRKMKICKIKRRINN